MFGHHRDPDVLVAGAGPVGLFTALHLKQRGLEPRVVDEEWRTATHSYALALHPEALRLLESVGALHPLLEHSYRVRTVGLYDRVAKRAELKLSDLSEDFSFVAVTRQDVLESVLENRLKDAGVKVDWNHRILSPEHEGDVVGVPVQRLTKSSGGYAVTHSELLVAKDMRWRVPYLIGCDGHRSLVRRALDVPFEEVGPPLHVAVFEFKTDFDLGNELRVVLNDDDTNVMWPMPDGYCRWSFQLPDQEAALDSRVKGRLAVQLGGQHYPVLETERLEEFLADRAPWFGGSIEDVRWRMVVRFENRLAASAGKARQWLAGDSLHMTGPIGGQSMNVGLREGYDLAHRIHAVLREGASNELLQQYEHERHAEWRFLLGVEGGLEPTEGTDPWITARADRLVPCLPASGNDLRTLASQVGLEAPMTAARV